MGGADEPRVGAVAGVYGPFDDRELLRPWGTGRQDGKSHVVEDAVAVAHGRLRVMAGRAD